MSGLSDRLLEKALAFVKTKDWEKADAQLIEFMKFEPQDTDGWIMRGNIHSLHKRWMDAILNYEKALGYNDNLYDAWSNRGVAFSNMGMWDAAEDSFKRAIAVADRAEPHIGLGNMYHALCRLDEAEREVRKAIELDPTAGLHLQLGLVLLGQGRWDEAFEHYYARWQDNPKPPNAFTLLPRWEGQDLTGKSIVLCPEQGYGDEVMAYRFADRDLLGADKVYVQARMPLFNLAKMLEHCDGVFPLYGTVPKADYCAALLDVIRFKELGPFDLPRPLKYLKVPNPWRMEQFRRQLPQNKLNVGVCWSSGTSFGMTSDVAQMKSFPVHMLADLQHDAVNLVSLQKIKWEKIPEGVKLIDFMEDIDDFADTAAIIEACDFIVSVDTAVAHVAGALGKPVVNLVRFAGFFPWLAPHVAPSPDYSIWYPSMKLYRQPKIGDWATPLARAAKDIRQLVETRA